jgi:hypothetical protein
MQITIKQLKLKVENHEDLKTFSFTDINNETECRFKELKTAYFNSQERSMCFMYVRICCG